MLDLKGVEYELVDVLPLNQKVHMRMAGFRGEKMISSNNNLLFSYMLYLIGRTEYGVEAFTLRRVIAQWFFMSAVTGRFTGSPESAMEFDLARLRGLKAQQQGA